MSLDPSRLILGCGNFGGVGSLPELFGLGDSELAARALLDTALNAGIDSFDTAHSYGGGSSEVILGRWLHALGKLGYQLKVTTKVGNPHSAKAGLGQLCAEEIERQLAISLLRLKRESVDVLLLHEPDPHTPLASSMEGLQRCLTQGMFKSFGLSNVNLAYAQEFLLACPHTLRKRLKHVQNEFHFLEQGDSNALIPFLHTQGILYSAFSPLAGGLLSGKYKHGEAPPSGSRLALRPQPYLRFLDANGFNRIDSLANEARKLGETLPQAALRFALGTANTAVIGPRKPEQLLALLALPAKAPPVRIPSATV